MLSNKIACFLALVLPLIAVAVSDPTTRVTIHEKERFSLLLPPNPGSNSAEGWEQPVSYCTSPTAQVRYAKEMPSGFIKSAYYGRASDLSYSQVTGTFDRAVFSLSETFIAFVAATTSRICPDTLPELEEDFTESLTDVCEKVTKHWGTIRTVVILESQRLPQSVC
ncbi:MAG: hypothetical protein J3Q66DRAFT_416418 [Benniella sp.]|nr:MAG: hypothetical protein J3Q66DRAFT_416418 [Benniella sp.]